MTPVRQKPVELRIAEAVEPELFVDEADLREIVVCTIHRVEWLDERRAPVSYRMEISGPAADTPGSHRPRDRNRQRANEANRRGWFPGAAD
jgi:hypothetical protein